MDEQYFRILFFVLWFILPLIPAFILYKYLPSNQVAVKGPFKGLTVDMAGAFAGYFLLFLGSYFIVNKILFEKKLEYEVWTVKANLIDEKGIRVDRDKHRPIATILPPPEIRNGVFDILVPVKVDKNYYDFPLINIEATSSDSSRSPLSIGGDISDFFDIDVVKGDKNGNWDYKFDRKIVKYNKPIVLTSSTTVNNAFIKVVQMDSINIEIDSLRN